MIHIYLYCGVPEDHVSANGVSLDSRCQKYPIRVPENRVVFDYVSGISRTNKTDTEVVPLRFKSISTGPVPTEPVMACASR
jgi:hypothetical protein